MNSYGEETGKPDGSLRSPSALQHLSHRLEIPQNTAPGSDFATGYSLGLIGGVRSWVRQLSPSSEGVGKLIRKTIDDTKSPNKSR